MKKLVFAAALIIGGLTFTSCGSTAPCGLAQKSKVENKNIENQEVIVAGLETETNN